jgi:hypothetical protein
VVVFLVLNWMFVWPEFSDWDNLQMRSATAERKLALYQKAITMSAGYQKLVKEMESSGEVVAPEDQGISFNRTILNQQAASGVAIGTTSKQITHTNDQFFVEQWLNLNISGTDPQIVDFLYKLGNDASMIRVRDLELQPDPPHQHLNANIRLVASYQKVTPVKTGTKAK